MQSGLSQSIVKARDAAGIALLPFVPAGYPSLAATAATIEALDHPGIGAIEVGFPFSDPIADGPVIQEAFNVALNAGVRTKQVFETIASIKRKPAPLVAMVSCSIVFGYGLDRFINDANAAGFAGILVPDLPPPEAQAICPQIRSAGLETVLLVAPTTPAARRKQIVELSSGFVYCLSVSGITGERTALPANLVEHVEATKALSKVPVCVGFGISNRSHLDLLKGHADGAIVGSAIVKTMTATGSDPAKIGQAVRGFVDALLNR